MISGMSSLQMPKAHCGTHCCFSQTSDLHVKCSISAADAEHFCICVPHQIVSMAVLIILDRSDSQHLSIDIRNGNSHLLDIHHSQKPKALAVLSFLRFTRTLNELSRSWLLSCPKLRRILTFFSGASWNLAQQYVLFPFKQAFAGWTLNLRVTGRSSESRFLAISTQ